MTKEKKRMTTSVLIIGLFGFISAGYAGYAEYLRGECRDSLNVRTIGRWPYGPTNTVFVNGNIAYIGNGASFQILDVSGPSMPALLGEIFLPSMTIEGIHVCGDYAYVANEWCGLRIIDVTDPDSPSEIAFYETPDIAFGVFVKDTLAYVADRNSGLWIINIATPQSPFAIGSYNTTGAAYDVHVIDTIAYVADNDKGLRIINVANPQSPYEIGYYDTGGYVDGVYADSLIYMADLRDGLYISELYGVGISEHDQQLSAASMFLQVHPNPFSKSTVISYSSLVINDQLPVTNDLQCPALRIYDVSGRLVMNFNLKSEISNLQSAISWTGVDDSHRKLPNGVYILRCSIGDYAATKKLILLR